MTRAHRLLDIIDCMKASSLWVMGQKVGVSMKFNQPPRMCKMVLGSYKNVKRQQYT
jgi:hypothetical protein